MGAIVLNGLIVGIGVEVFVGCFVAVAVADGVVVYTLFFRLGAGSTTGLGTMLQLFRTIKARRK